MYKARDIQGEPAWLDPDGIKIYTITADTQAVKQDLFTSELAAMKASLCINWPAMAAFAIFHSGLSRNYLILCWWDNDNELFTRVAVEQAQGWVTEPLKFSFCIYDMQIMWRERTLYIEAIMNHQPVSKPKDHNNALNNYRHTR